MLLNILDSDIRRKVTTCNFNQHIYAPHPDRIMQEHDLIFIKEGDWDICQDDVPYHVAAGDVILLQAGRHHYGMEPAASIVKTRFIHFTRCQNDRINETGTAGSVEYVFPMIVHCGKNPLIEHYFDSIIYAFWHHDPYAVNKTSSLLDLLLCEISSMKEKSSRNYSLVEDVKLTIRRNPDRFIGNQELAEQCCCSVRTLTSRFKEETGYGVHAWQMKVKCEMAKELLRTDASLTLKEVAATFGFCDEYHFSKCYKKEFGKSPKY